jgi:hypothetical protein
MLYQYMRILKKDDLGLHDLSIINQDETNFIDFESESTDSFYIGKYLPFNNFYIDIKKICKENVNINISIWTGRNWEPAADILDGTCSSLGTFKRSGVIQFFPDKKDKWTSITDTSLYAQSGLSSKKIYDLYWIKISFSDQITECEANKISYLFTTSQQLDNIDVQINSYLSAFGTGKTNWNTEIMTASSQIVAELRSRGVIKEEGELLRLSDISHACDYKSLSIIYTSLGVSFTEKRDYYENKYSQLISQKYFTLDQDENGSISTSELNRNTTEMVR